MIVGCQLPVPLSEVTRNRTVDSLKVPYEIQQVVAGIDQNIKVQFDTKMSMKELFESDLPALEQLVAGFRL